MYNCSCKWRHVAVFVMNAMAFALLCCGYQRAMAQNTRLRNLLSLVIEHQDTPTAFTLVMNATCIGDVVWHEVFAGYGDVE